MKVICAWCGVSLPDAVLPPDDDSDEGTVSHGICKECLEKQLKEMGAEWRREMAGDDEEAS